MAGSRGDEIKDLTIENLNLLGIEIANVRRNDAADSVIGSLESDRKPTAIVEKLATQKGALSRKKPDQVTLNTKNSGFVAKSDLVISVSEIERLKETTRYYISEQLDAGTYLALREAYKKKIDERSTGNDKQTLTGSQVDALHQGYTYDTLENFINQSDSDVLKRYLNGLSDDDKQMPLCAFVAMNVGHSVSTISLLSSDPANKTLANQTNPFTLIDLSGIDLQHSKVTAYFFQNKEKTEARLSLVLNGLMARQKQICLENKSDVVVGMPRGLASFAASLKEDQKEALQRQYWKAYFEMVAASPNIAFYINPIGQLKPALEKELRLKHNVDNLKIVRGVDVRSLAVKINDMEHEKKERDPDYKMKLVGYDNAGDQMGLLDERKLGRHWRVKGTGAVVGQDELTNATTLAGITTKAANLENIVVHINAKESKYGSTALSRAVVAGNVAEVERLLAMPGIEVDARDNNNNTPLIWALAENKPAIALLLIRAGATLDAVDHKTKMTALQGILSIKPERLPNASEWNEVVNVVRALPVTPVIVADPSSSPKRGVPLTVGQARKASPPLSDLAAAAADPSKAALTSSSSTSASRGGMFAGGHRNPQAKEAKKEDKKEDKKDKSGPSSNFF